MLSTRLKVLVNNVKLPINYSVAKCFKERAKYFFVIKSITKKFRKKLINKLKMYSSKI